MTGQGGRDWLTPPLEGRVAEHVARGARYETLGGGMCQISRPHPVSQFFTSLRMLADHPHKGAGKRGAGQ